MSRTLEVTTNIGCSLGCPYCPQPALRRAWRTPGSRGAARLTLESFRALLASVPTFVDVHFSGFAEPWHAPACTAMLRYALERGHRVAVFTTTDGMTDDDIGQLAGLIFKRFVIHLPDAAGELQVHVDEAYLRRLSALRNAVDGLEFLTLGVPHPTVRDRIGWTPSSRRVHTRAGNVSELGGQVGSAFAPEEIARQTRGVLLGCRQDRMFANVLLPDGDVHWCAMDYGLEHPLGNLYREQWEDVVRGAAFQALLSRMATPDGDLLCRRCEYAVPRSDRLAPA